MDANESTFDIEVKAQPTVVLDLWAPWCGPCRFVSPILDQLAHQYVGRLKVVKVNVDENQGLARRFDAMSIPTIIVHARRPGREPDRRGSPQGADGGPDRSAYQATEAERGRRVGLNPSLAVASPAGFEPATFRLEGGCSVH